MSLDACVIILSRLNREIKNTLTRMRINITCSRVTGFGRRSLRWGDASQSEMAPSHCRLGADVVANLSQLMWRSSNPTYIILIDAHDCIEGPLLNLLTTICMSRMTKRSSSLYFYYLFILFPIYCYY